jgi:hypothetical protein
MLMVLLVLSGLLVSVSQATTIAAEQPAYSPRETLSWPGSPDPRGASMLPLSAFDGQLAARVYLVREITSIAVYDPASNRVYRGGDAGPIAGASLSKVLLAVIALRQLEQRGAGEDEISSVESLIYPTIAYSDNDYANEVWALIGRQPAVSEFVAQTGLTGFSAPHPWDWGQISATSSDWAILFAMLGSGQLLNQSNTAAMLSMMDDVIEEHRWGVLAERDDSVSYGKNGWYMDEDAAWDWRVNSAGFVSVAEPDHNVTPRVVVVMTRYPADAGMSYGVELATRVTDRVVNCTHIQHARTTLSQRSASCTSNRETSMLMDRVHRIW